MKEIVKQLPAVHELQKHKQAQILIEKHKISEEKLTIQIKKLIAEIREQILTDSWYGALPNTEIFFKDFFNKLDNQLINRHTYNLKKTINATGIVLHTNLGRARLSEQVIRQVVEVARNYSNVEYQLEKGVRGSRHTIVEEYLTEITGAEAALVVNNNAAAVFLILSVFAKGKEAVVSRGELVEIGGSFRISAIMEESGAILHEVGTTNKTRLADYQQAINETTSILMKVHTSNFKMIGFTESVEREMLFELAKQYQLISYEDLGSGALVDFEKFGIGDDPIVKDVIAKGADLVSFSGDKLIGGPQAGIIVGKSALIEQLKKHQLARVLRVDKMTLAALEATLMEYTRGTSLNIPTVRDILQTEEEIEIRVDCFLNKLARINLELNYFIVASDSTIGGGTLPGVEIPSVCVGIQFDHLSAERLHYHLRIGEPAVIGMIRDDILWLDFRTIADEEIEDLLIALQAVSKKASE